MRYSSEPAVYTTHVRGNAPLNPPAVNASQPAEVSDLEDVANARRAIAEIRERIKEERASQSGVIAAQTALRAEMAANAAKMRQFDEQSGMRGVGPVTDLNPDRRAAVAKSEAGAALVNPDAGYTMFSPDLNVAGPPYQPDEGAEEEKGEDVQQEAKSPSRFGRFRNAMRDLIGQQPSARVVPVEHAIRHRRDIELAFAPADRGVFASTEMLEGDVPMAVESSLRELRAGARNKQYVDTLQRVRGGESVFDLKITALRVLAGGLEIPGRTNMSRDELAAAVSYALNRKG